jgi:hypothetical protein
MTFAWREAKARKKIGNYIRPEIGAPLQEIILIFALIVILICCIFFGHTCLKISYSQKKSCSEF